MTKLIFDEAKLEQTEGALWLSLRLQRHSLPHARKLVFERKPGLFAAKISRHHPKRSNNANSYCWVLCEEIGKSMFLPKEDIYRAAVRKVGSFCDLWVPEGQAMAVKTCWEHNGLGWITEDMGVVGGYTTIHAYKGSSVYDRAEMARLIDYLVEEAKGLGIETATPDEIASMKALWDADEGKPGTNRHPYG